MRQQQDTGCDFRSPLAAWLAVLAFLMLALPAAAQPGRGFTNIAASLAAESTEPAPGSGTNIAIHFTPKPTWHGYWQNPGDAGFPGRFEWSLPKGVTIAAPRYPVPERLVISGLMNHVFNGEHALIARLFLDKSVAPGTRLPLKLKAEWLACTDKVCVPESSELALTLTAGEGKVPQAAQAQFDGWRAKLARPLGSPARFAVDADTIRLAIPWPASQPVTSGWFFAATEKAVAYGNAQRLRQQGDELLIDLPRTTADYQQPAKLAGVLALADGTGIEISADSGTVAVSSAAQIILAADPAAAPDAPELGWATILAALGGALLGGVLLNIMPCVFPVISLKALSLAKAGGDERAARSEALAYSGGVILTCLAMGALLLGLRAGGQAVGWAFQLQQPVIILFLLLVSVAITANLLGLFELSGIGGDGGLTAKQGNIGAFWTGVLAAFVATPCTGPFMAAALGAALVLPAAAALAIFAGLGLGMALPFLLIGFVPRLRAMLPKPGAWMLWFRRIMAIPMALTALALIWLLSRQTGTSGALIGLGGALLLTAALWVMRRRFVSPLLLGAAMVGLSALGWPILPNQAQSSQTAMPGAIAFDPARLAALRAEGRPVFLYFTADWCVTCKVNERAAIERDETIAHFKDRNVAVMIGDWSRPDPVITRFLEEQGRSGVPLYLYYAPGASAPQVLPQILTVATLTGL